jgi:hypothetical protein
VNVSQRINIALHHVIVKDVTIPQIMLILFSKQKLQLMKEIQELFFPRLILLIQKG